MKKFNKSLMAGLVAAGLVASFSANATNGYFSHGYGTKNKGLAGSGVALPQDAMIAATNPAGMAHVGERMDLGVAVFSPSPRSYSATAANSGCSAPGQCAFTLGSSVVGAGAGSTGQTIESENDYFLIPHFAYTWAMGSGDILGLSVYGNGGMNTEYEGGVATYSTDGTNGGYTTTAGTYGAGTAGVNLEQLFIAVTYAGKFSATGSWGVSPILAYQRFEAKGLSSFFGYSVDGNSLTNMGVDDSMGFGFKFGIQEDVMPGLTLAASYQTKMDMEEFSKYKGLFAEGGDFDIPETWTIGLAWKTAPTSTLTFDIQQINYSDVAAIGNPIGNLTNGTCTPGGGGASGTGPGCLGGASGAGFGWEDMTIYKLGYQWKQDDNMTWRVGYSYGEQPIPENQVLFNILAPAVMEQHLTFGFTKKTGADSEFNFAAMYAPKNSVTGANAFNTNQNITLEMTQYELEASWGWKF
ncbi:MAG: outer membrane protein transport protein [Gammaproteobacteria bacterium]